MIDSTMATSVAPPARAAGYCQNRGPGETPCRMQSGLSTLLGLRGRSVDLTRAGLVMGLLLLLNACAYTRHHMAAGIGEHAALGRGAAVLIVEPDIELTELLSSGLQQPRADWTTAARKNVNHALESALAAREARISHFRPSEDVDLAARQRQIILLHRAVGRSILLHGYFGSGLASKGKRFDWTLGPGARKLDPAARYALFVLVRDSYGSGISPGEQFGFASLVDLNDGRLIWFNLLQAQTGDLRDAAGTLESVARLLDGLPL